MSVLTIGCYFFKKWGISSLREIKSFLQFLKQDIGNIQIYLYANSLRSKQFVNFKELYTWYVFSILIFLTFYNVVEYKCKLKEAEEAC